MLQNRARSRAPTKRNGQLMTSPRKWIVVESTPRDSWGVWVTVVVVVVSLPVRRLSVPTMVPGRRIRSSVLTVVVRLLAHPNGPLTNSMPAAIKYRTCRIFVSITAYFVDVSLDRPIIDSWSSCLSWWWLWYSLVPARLSTASSNAHIACHRSPRSPPSQNHRALLPIGPAAGSGFP